MPTRARASSRRGSAQPPGPRRKVSAPGAGGLCFPQSKSLGLDPGAASQSILAKVTYAGTVSRSFGQARDALPKLADVPIPEKQVERVTQRIGAACGAERVATVAVVMVDGGRLLILERRPPEASAVTPPAHPRGTEAAGQPAEAWDEDADAGPKASPWREDRWACS